jgi:Xaa-Pro aminopeptidase
MSSHHSHAHLTPSPLAHLPGGERVNTPISTAELERRWAAVRAQMAEKKIDVLLMQATQDFMGGYVKYFTDTPASNGYPITVVFPKDDLITMIRQGDIGGEESIPASGNARYRGVKKLLYSSFFTSAYYTLDYYAELAAKALREGKSGTIGLVGRGSLGAAFVDYLRAQFPSAKFVDASDMVDRIMCIKSDEEIALIKRTAALQDAALDAGMKAVAAGKREIEIVAEAERAVLIGGGEQALLLALGHEVGKPQYWNHRHTQARPLRDGDMFSLLVESNGPGGFYCEMSRTGVLGKATQVMQDEFGFMMEVRQRTLKQISVGQSCKDIWDEYNSYMRKHDRQEERRLHFHGQGYDLVERPLVRMDEPMVLEKRMNLAFHPTYLRSGIFNTICDNYLIDANGQIERLHRYPEILMTLA